MTETYLANINKTLAMVNDVDTIPDARKLLALAQGYVVSARKLYSASSINSIAEVGEDKNKSEDIAHKAGELKLYAEARLGELIKLEQAAGRLASQDSGRPNKYSNDGIHISTLEDYNLTAKDSYRAQQLAEHKDIIAQVIVDSLDIPTRSAVEREIKIRQHEDKKSETKPPVLPSGVFDVIVIDPPWPYGGGYNPDSHRIESPYPEMELPQIEQWGIDNIKPAKDCILWLWTTNSFMHEAYHILQVWDFEPKTILTWVKDRMGVGYWLRGQTEHCILAVKGKPIIKLTNQSTVLMADNKGHSSKPDEFYEMVEKLCPGTKIDMFARDNRIGWETYGNQIG